MYKRSSVSARVFAKSELDGGVYISDRTCLVQLDLDIDNFIDYFEYKCEEKRFLRNIKELEEFLFPETVKKKILEKLAEK